MAEDQLNCMTEASKPAGRSYFAVRRSPVQPSLLRWLAKDQAGTPIAFCEAKRKVCYATVPIFANKSGAHFSGKSTSSNKSCNGARADAALVHEHEGGET